MLLRAGKRITLAGPDTDIVIEGFPRSGNTFAVAAFLVANGRTVRIGRHLHGAPHVLRAVRYGLPTLVLVRKPADAVPSYLVRRPSLTPEDALLEYLDFYRTAWRVRDGFVVGLFDDVVSDYGAVLHAVDDRFGTHFARWEPTEENQAAAFALVEEMNLRECQGRLVETHVGRPSAERTDRNHEIRSRMREARAQRLLTEADDLYTRYIVLARSRTVA